MNTLLNVRVDRVVRSRATARARSLGVPLSLVIRHMLARFADSKEAFVIGAPEEIKMTPAMQKRANTFMDKVDLAVAKKLKLKK